MNDGDSHGVALWTCGTRLWFCALDGPSVEFTPE
jgi:hypothetical protein